MLLPSQGLPGQTLAAEPLRPEPVQAADGAGPAARRSCAGAACLGPGWAPPPSPALPAPAEPGPRGWASQHPQSCPAPAPPSELRPRGWPLLAAGLAVGSCGGPSAGDRTRVSGLRLEGLLAAQCSHASLSHEHRQLRPGRVLAPPTAAALCQDWPRRSRLRGSYRAENPLLPRTAQTQPHRFNIIYFREVSSRKNKEKPNRMTGSPTLQAAGGGGGAGAASSCPGAGAALQVLVPESWGLPGEGGQHPLTVTEGAVDTPGKGGGGWVTGWGPRAGRGGRGPVRGRGGRCHARHGRARHCSASRCTGRPGSSRWPWCRC